MRCDPNPLGCEPCRQKNVACRTTDRITGRASERGRVEGLESELALCRAEVAAYRQRYGPIDVQTSNGYHNQSAGGYVAYVGTLLIVSGFFMGCSCVSPQ